MRIEGIQIFAGQVTLAQPQMLPVTEEDRDIPNEPIVIPPHALFAGNGGSGPQPVQHCTPRVLEQVVIPKNITVHLGKPAAAARNVTVSFRDYIANVASSEVYPTWVGQNKPTNRFKSRLCSKIPFYRHFLRSRQRFFRFYDDPVNEEYHKFPCQIGNLR